MFFSVLWFGFDFFFDGVVCYLGFVFCGVVVGECCVLWLGWFCLGLLCVCWWVVFWLVVGGFFCFVVWVGWGFCGVVVFGVVGAFCLCSFVLFWFGSEVFLFCLWVWGLCAGGGVWVCVMVGFCWVVCYFCVLLFLGGGGGWVGLCSCCE